MADGSWLCHKLREIVLYGWSPVFLKGVLPQIAAARGLTPGTTAHEGVGQLQLVAAWVYPEVEDDFVIREIEEIGVTVCMRTGPFFYLLFLRVQQLMLLLDDDD